MRNEDTKTPKRKQMGPPGMGGGGEKPKNFKIAFNRMSKELTKSIEEENDGIVPNIDSSSLLSEDDFSGFVLDDELDQMSVEENGELTDEELDADASDDYSEEYSDIEE